MSTVPENVHIRDNENVIYCLTYQDHLQSQYTKLKRHWTDTIHLLSYICGFTYLYFILPHVYSNWDYTALIERVIGKWWIGKDLKGSSHDLI
jgi:hypothetical protein